MAAIFTGCLHQTINASTLRIAANRGIGLYVDEMSEAVQFCEIDEHGDLFDEHMFAYGIGSDGSLIWRGNIYLPEDVKSELPYWIDTKQKLDQVIDYVFRNFVKARITK